MIEWVLMFSFINTAQAIEIHRVAAYPTEEQCEAVKGRYTPRILPELKSRMFVECRMVGKSGTEGM